MLLNLFGNKHMSRIGESRELDSLVTQMGVAKLSKMAKPASAEKKRIRASAGLSGVVRDSAYGKDDRGTREALLLEVAKRESITSSQGKRESERRIRAKKQTNISGAKGPY